MSAGIDLFGLLTAWQIRTSDALPEFGNPDALPDYEDRLAAMTLYHLDLSLLDLTVQERVVFAFDRTLLCHPNNLAAVRAGLARGPR